MASTSSKTLRRWYKIHTMYFTPWNFIFSRPTYYDLLYYEPISGKDIAFATRYSKHIKKEIVGNLYSTFFL